MKPFLKKFIVGTILLSPFIIALILTNIIIIAPGTKVAEISGELFIIPLCLLLLEIGFFGGIAYTMHKSGELK